MSCTEKVIHNQKQSVFLAHPVHGFCWKFTWLSSSNFENPLRIDKVIAMSSVCSFFWPTLYIYVNMVQVIGVFYTSAAECPVGLLVERLVACIGPRFDSLVLL